ncbi:MAG: hypothetical protein DRG78_06140 [Epsilonproteobacteria bacterium]|nr:MAG: hypothetical protein DRG78_06140 [Campylobacterota bacterium]
MIRINPMLVLLLAIVIFIVSISSLKQSEIELNSQIENRSDFILLSDKYKSLKSTWGKKDIQKELKKIAKQLSIKDIVVVKKDKLIIVKIKNKNIRDIDRFINKILNNSFLINKLNITSKQAIIEIGR